MFFEAKVPNINNHQQGGGCEIRLTPQIVAVPDVCNSDGSLVTIYENGKVLPVYDFTDVNKDTSKGGSPGNTFYSVVDGEKTFQPRIVFDELGGYRLLMIDARGQEWEILPEENLQQTEKVELPVVEPVVEPPAVDSFVEPVDENVPATPAIESQTEPLIDLGLDFKTKEERKAATDGFWSKLRSKIDPNLGSNILILILSAYGVRKLSKWITNKIDLIKNPPTPYVPTDYSNYVPDDRSGVIDIPYTPSPERQEAVARAEQYADRIAQYPHLKNVIDPNDPLSNDITRNLN